MSSARSIALPCRISRGVCDGECIFEIDLLDGSTHVGFAPADLFWQLDGGPVDDGDLLPGERRPAILAAHLIGKDGESTLVSAPEGFVGLVDGASIQSRPHRACRA